MAETAQLTHLTKDDIVVINRPDCEAHGTYALVSEEDRYREFGGGRWLKIAMQWLGTNTERTYRFAERDLRLA